MIFLNAIVLLSLVIPAVRGYLNGFVKTALRFFRFLGAFVLACLLSRPISVWLKERWLEKRFYRLIESSVRKSFDGSADSMADAVPSGSKAFLESLNFNVSNAADSAASEGASALDKFVSEVSGTLASAASVVLAFVGLFIAFYFALILAARGLTVLVERVPIVRGINRLAGLGVGFLVGVFTAWTVAQLLVFTLTTFTEVDYSRAALLNFFHDISPFRLLFRLMVRGLSNAMI